MPKQAISYNSIELLSEENVKKFVLPQYSLKNAHINRIKFKNTDKQRAVYKVEHENTSYCLKKVFYPKDELLFVYSAIEWWYRNGIKVPRILPTNKGGRFVNYENMLFILTPWIEGEKCNYDNHKHLLDTGVNLAKMHKSSMDFVPILGSSHKKGYSTIYNSMYKHFQNLLEYSNLAFNAKDEFSRIYLNNLNEGLKLAQTSSFVASSINNANLTKSLCHLDYVNKNIIFDKNSDLWVIDFDNCRMDYSAHDISYSLRRVLKRNSTNWDFKLILKWLYLYNEIYPLNVDDYKYIFVYLAFPQRYWKLSRDYYRNIDKCNKKAFVKMLKKGVRCHNAQLQFVDNFKRYIEDKFNTKLY